MIPLILAVALLLPPFPGVPTLSVPVICDRLLLTFDNTQKRVYNYNMNNNKQRVTVKIWVSTRQLLNLVSATTGETMMEVMHRLVSGEWGKIRETTPIGPNGKSNE